MMVMGFGGDFLGRKWGSRLAASVMLCGAIMLCFTPFAPDSASYYTFFLTAQTFFGIGVGGEYPMAASSAAEKAEMSEGLDEYRGRQVVLVFANQGLGNMMNTIVCLICFLAFGLAQDFNNKGNALLVNKETQYGSMQSLSLMYGVGTVFLAFATYYRVMYLEESELYSEEMAKQKASGKAGFSMKNTLKCLWLYWPRQFAASFTWFCNDFAFYGNKLQQGVFIKLLFPALNPFGQMQWTALNSFVALTGYWTAAYFIDKKYYGRKNMQNVGFLAMFIIYLIIYVQWWNMVATVNLPYGMQWFQGLYYLSSYFNQFGPNCTTWLIAGECFPTAIRTTNHGIAATVGKVGAIISTVWIVAITGISATNATTQPVFLVSAMWSIAGMISTMIWMPETTGLNLKELDEFHRCQMEGRPQDYTGEAINPAYLSLWEIYCPGYQWAKHYVPLPPGRARRIKKKDSGKKPAMRDSMYHVEEGAAIKAKEGTHDGNVVGAATIAPFH